MGPAGRADAFRGLVGDDPAGIRVCADHAPAGVRAGELDGRLMLLERPEALQLIDAAFPDSAMVLTLGGTIREMLAVVGRKPNHLYCLDSMGQPLAIGLGLALGISER